MEDKKETFNYTYSGKHNEEIRRIREKYTPSTPEKDKMEELRRLDESATKLATAVSIVVGVLGALVLGVGMCFTMISDWSDTLFVPGIFIGVVGIGLIAAAYPVYTRMVKAKRKKLAPEILRLTDELMKQQ